MEYKCEKCGNTVPKIYWFNNRNYCYKCVALVLEENRLLEALYQLNQESLKRRYGNDDKNIHRGR